jgi:hypothetical protein
MTRASPGALHETNRPAATMIEMNLEEVLRVESKDGDQYPTRGQPITMPFNRIGTLSENQLGVIHLEISPQESRQEAPGT